jgi:FkbM family methyltransferase
MNLRRKIKYLIHSHCPGLTGWFHYFDTKVHFPPRAWIFELACEQGIYEAELLRLIGGLARPGSWYFDIGANVGLMSVPVLSRRSDVSVLSFEPSPNSAPYITRTCKESPWQNRWQVRAKAVGKEKGRANFSFGESHLGGYDGLLHTGRVATVGSHEVEITTIDDEWAELGKPDVSVIKLDIEGAELDALAGGHGVLQSCKPWIILEWYAGNLGPYGQKPCDLLDWAKANSYQVVCIPTMTVAHSPAMLEALMVGTSGFMLMPE